MRRGHHEDRVRGERGTNRAILQKKVVFGVRGVVGLVAGGDVVGGGAQTEGDASHEKEIELFFYKRYTAEGLGIKTDVIKFVHDSSHSLDEAFNHYIFVINLNPKYYQYLIPPKHHHPDLPDPDLSGIRL